mmetsp:Transcript_5851/g.11150  ORF Transcript_5851/g.11150 Transcript_5851/m.11150 type:complete len:211 (+) Transcript_5851:2335-2967(+)
MPHFHPYCSEVPFRGPNTPASRVNQPLGGVEDLVNFMSAPIGFGATGVEGFFQAKIHPVWLLPLFGSTDLHNLNARVPSRRVGSKPAFCPCHEIPAQVVGGCALQYKMASLKLNAFCCHTDVHVWLPSNVVLPSQLGHGSSLDVTFPVRSRSQVEIEHLGWKNGMLVLLRKAENTLAGLVTGTTLTPIRNLPSFLQPICCMHWSTPSFAE